MSRSNDYFGGASGPQALLVPGGGLIAYPFEEYQTLLIDLTVGVAGIEVVPAKPNHAPVLYTARWIIEKHTGTQTVPATFKMGSDASHSNYTGLTSTGPSNTDVNNANPPSLSGYSLGSLFLALTNKLLPNATIFLDTVAPAQGTGGFSLLARLTIQNYWLAVI